MSFTRIAFYTLQHLKHGRRSYSSSRSDVLNAGTQLDGNSALIPIDVPIAQDEVGDALTLSEMIADGHEDPAQEASRNVDWEAFLKTQDAKAKAVLYCVAEGRKLRDVGRRFKVSDSTVHEIKRKLAEELRTFMGATVMEDVNRKALWRGTLNAAREKLACKDRHRGI